MDEHRRGHRHFLRFLGWRRRRRAEHDDEEDDMIDDEMDDADENHDEDAANDSAAGSKSSSSLVSEITFDKTLPRAHSYLGNDLEDVHGRTIHDDDSLISLPVLSLPGVVLLPGQILPLYLFQPSIVAMVKQVLERDRTFGYIAASGYDEDVPKIGTTAEVLAVKEDFDNLSGLTATKVKAIGRQRFTVINTRRQLDGILMADVKVLPEKIMSDPLDGAVTASMRRTSLRAHNCSRDDVHLSSATFTHWPPWVYRQYDARSVMKLVQKELLSWNETFSMDSMPADANDFSYWVAQTLPFEDPVKLRLLSIDTAVQRLRCELSYMRQCAVLCCIQCNSAIAKKTDIFTMSVEGPLGAYVNPGGYVHEMLTVAQSKGLRLVGRPSEEASWFTGYAWTIAQCRRCNNHMGWRFTVASGRKLKPDKFWGLCRASLKLSLDSQAEDAQDVWQL